MAKVAKLDSAMQRGLDNGFAFIFGGKVVPAEIEEALKQVAEDNLENSTEAHNVFEISVSSKDFQNLQTQNPQLAQDFADQIARYLRNQGWITPGPVVVSITEDESLRTGQLHAHSSAQADPTPTSTFRPAQASAPTPAVEPTVTLLLQDGSSRTYLVESGSNIIGRGNEADFRLPDTGVSRQHVDISWDGQDAVLTDLQSTNGTTVNDTPVENWLLADGDVITVGHSHIEVRIITPQED